jgi:hypothetical protein
VATSLRASSLASRPVRGGLTINLATNQRVKRRDRTNVCMCHLDHLLQLPWADHPRVPPTEAARSKYILRVTSIAAPVKISRSEGWRLSERRPKPLEPRRESMLLRLAGPFAPLTLRCPCSTAVQPVHPCTGVRRHAAHPCVRPVPATQRRDSDRDPLASSRDDDATTLRVP